MEYALTQEELLQIEHHIEEIDAELDVLDPSNSIESQQIETKRLILQSYIAQLESGKVKPMLHLVR